jgi:hypothetical protein
VNAYAALQHSAAQADVEAEAFTIGIDRLNKSMGEARAGGGAMLGFLNKISPTMGREILATKNNEQALRLLTDAFAQIEDPSKRAALASAVFGKGGAQLGVWLHQGSAAIREQASAYLRLAGDQRRAAEVAGRLDNVLREAALPLGRLANAVMIGLAPSLERLAPRLSEIVDKLAPRFEALMNRAGAAVLRWVDGGGVDRLVGWLESAADKLRQVTDVLGPVGTALLVSAPLWGPVATAIVSIVPAAISAAAALGPLGLAIAAVGFAAGTLSASWAQHGDAFLSEIQDLWREVKWLFADGLAWIEHTVAKIGEALRGIDLGSMTPLGALLTAGKASVGEAGWTQRANGGAGGEGRNALGSVASRVFGGGAALSPTGVAVSALRSAAAPPAQATVTVDFANVPRGTRVAVAPTSTAEVNYSMGLAMVTP